MTTPTDVRTALELAAEYEAGTAKAVATGYEEFGPAFQRKRKLIVDALRSYAAQGAVEAVEAVEPGDETASAPWNNGCDFAIMQLCIFLGVNPADVSWDAATETVDGDVQAVIGNILRAKFGDDWGPNAPPDLDAGTVEACAKHLAECYPGHAWLNAACAALRTLKPEADTKAGDSPITRANRQNGDSQ